MHGKFVWSVILISFLLFGEILLRMAMWYSGYIPSFLLTGYDLHEPLSSGLPPAPGDNTGSYSPPI